MLVVQLAVSGDYGERSAMSVEKMWWGWSEPDQRAAAVMAKHAARSAAAAAPSLLAGAAAVSGLGGGAAAVARPSGGVPRNPCKLYIGSWPGDLAPDALKQHFAIFKPVDVMVRDLATVCCHASLAAASSFRIACLCDC